VPARTFYPTVNSEGVEYTAFWNQPASDWRDHVPPPHTVNLISDISMLTFELRASHYKVYTARPNSEKGNLLLVPSFTSLGAWIVGPSLDQSSKAIRGNG